LSLRESGLPLRRLELENGSRFHYSQAIDPPTNFASQYRPDCFARAAPEVGTPRKQDIEWI
jgi:hypothetical protein